LASGRGGRREVQAELIEEASAHVADPHRHLEQLDQVLRREPARQRFGGRGDNSLPSK
jgi:hypothetical protein